MTSNDEITNAIIKHIFTQLGLYDTTAVSIHHKAFLTDKTIAYENDNYEKMSAKVYACQTEISSKKLSIISSELDESENFVVVKFDSNPAYGLYLCSEYPSEDIIATPLVFQDGFLATQLKEKTWIPTTIYLQATFLAGMEQLRDLTSKYDKVKDIDVLFDLLKEFISYREAVCNVGSVATNNF